MNLSIFALSRSEYSSYFLVLLDVGFGWQIPLFFFQCSIFCEFCSRSRAVPGLAVHITSKACVLRTANISSSVLRLLLPLGYFVLTKVFKENISSIFVMVLFSKIFIQICIPSISYFFSLSTNFMSYLNVTLVKYISW